MRVVSDILRTEWVASDFKHEFGHGYLGAGDGYISDFIATDDNETFMIYGI